MTCYTFTHAGHSNHLTYKSFSISEVLRRCLDPLTHGQLGLIKPEVTDRKSVAQAPEPSPKESFREQGRLWHLQASFCRRSMLGHKPGQAIPWNVQNHFSSLPTIGSLLSWRLATAARGASTGTSGALS